MQRQVNLLMAHLENTLIVAIHFTVTSSATSPNSASWIAIFCLCPCTEATTAWQKIKRVLTNVYCAADLIWSAAEWRKPHFNVILLWVGWSESTYTTCMNNMLVCFGWYYIVIHLVYILSKCAKYLAIREVGPWPNWGCINAFDLNT